MMYVCLFVYFLSGLSDFSDQTLLFKESKYKAGFKLFCVGQLIFLMPFWDLGAAEKYRIFTKDTFLQKILVPLDLSFKYYNNKL